MALFSDDQLLEQLELARGDRTAQSFAPALDDLLRRHLSSPEDLDLVAVTSGPGSFTGLRIAVTAVKALAFATAARVIAVNTLDVLVHQLPADVDLACTVMDAQRQQFFAAYYRRQSDSTWQTTTPCHLVDQQRLLRDVPRDVMLTGPGLRKHQDQLPEDARTAPPDVWMPRAATVGRLAWRRHLAGQYDDLWSLAPQYHRASYAEEKRGR